MVIKIFIMKSLNPERPKVEIGAVEKMFKNGKEIGTGKVVAVNEEVKYDGNEFVPMWVIYFEVVKLIKEPI